MTWWQEIWIEAIPILVPALAGLILAVLGLATAYLRRMTAQIDGEVARRALDSAIAEAHLAAATAVRETQQTLVDEWKKAKEDGKLTPDEQARALEAARNKFRQVISQRSLDILLAAWGPVQEWIDSLLEAQVQALKVQQDPLRVKVSAAANPKS